MKWRQFLLSLCVALIVGPLLTTLMIDDPVRASAPEEGEGVASGVEITLLTEDGGRPDWSHALNVIAYDRLEADGYYDIHIIRPDGVEGPCMTCNHPTLPNKHIGNPAWHPGGQYLVIQAEKLEHNGSKDSATPGLGINNDLWIISRDGTNAVPITNVAEGMGVLHPHFSDDGTKLVWAERIADAPNPSGIWAIRLLSFGSDNPLDLRQAELTTYIPMGPALYETHGFSPDGSKIIFTAHDIIYAPNNSWLDIYTLDIETEALKRLTFSAYGWDEHAQYHNDGQYITWISSRDCNCYALPPDNIFTELYVMKADGTQKVRLTWLNEQLPPDAPRDVAADHSWGPSGSSLVLYVQKGEESRPLEGRLVRVDLSPSLFGE